MLFCIYCNTISINVRTVQLHEETKQPTASVLSDQSNTDHTEAKHTNH